MINPRAPNVSAAAIWELRFSRTPSTSKLESTTAPPPKPLSKLWRTACWTVCRRLWILAMRASRPTRILKTKHQLSGTFSRGWDERLKSVLRTVWEDVLRTPVGMARHTVGAVGEAKVHLVAVGFPGGSPSPIPARVPHGAGWRCPILEYQ
jgi:hypothetical protein